MPEQSDKKIDETLSAFSNGNAQVLRLLDLSVGRIWREMASKGKKWQSAASVEDIAHITNWLKVSVVNHSDWLRARNSDNQPLQLLAFNQIDEVVKMANQNLGEVCLLLGISLSTAYRRLKAGILIPAFRTFGGHRR